MKTLAIRLDKVLIFAAVVFATVIVGPHAEATDPQPAASQPQGQAQAQSQAQAVCGARPTVLTTLNGKYEERPVSMGLASNGTIVEVLSSEAGSWTIIMTAPNGVSCLIAAGDYWQAVTKPVAGLAL